VNIVPVAALWNLKAIVLRKPAVFLIALGFTQCGLVFFVSHIRDAFEEEQREHVSLEVRSIDRTTQDVGRFLEM